MIMNHGTDLPMLKTMTLRNNQFYNPLSVSLTRLRCAAA